jgi:hypothetical protein
MDLSYKMFIEIPLVVRHHWKAGNVNWLMTTWSMWAHVVALVGVFKIMDCSKETPTSMTMMSSCRKYHRCARLWMEVPYPTGAEN